MMEVCIGLDGIGGNGGCYNSYVSGGGSRGNKGANLYTGGGVKITSVMEEEHEEEGEE